MAKASLESLAFQNLLLAILRTLRRCRLKADRGRSQKQKRTFCSLLFFKIFSSCGDEKSWNRGGEENPNVAGAATSALFLCVPRLKTDHQLISAFFINQILSSRFYQASRTLL